MYVAGRLVFVLVLLATLIVALPSASSDDGSSRGRGDSSSRGKDDGSSKGKDDGSSRGRGDSSSKGRDDGSNKGKDDSSNKGKDDGSSKGKDDSSSSKGSSSNGSMETCLARAKDGPKADRNGTPREWLADICPGVFLTAGVSDPKTKETLFESCVWGLGHGSACYRCNTGTSNSEFRKQFKEAEEKNEYYYHACALRYKYELKEWYDTTGKQEARFVEWSKTSSAKAITSKPADKKPLDAACSGVFDDAKPEQKGTTYDACVWGFRHGAKCDQANGGKDMEEFEKATHYTCVSRYGEPDNKGEIQPAAEKRVSELKSKPVEQTSRN